MLRSRMIVAVSVGLTALLCGSSPALAQVLGTTASSFAVLGSTPNVTNVGPTIIFGSVGVSPAASITGLTPANIVPGSGSLHAGDLVAATARNEATTAYTTLSGLAGAAKPPALGGQTFTPGTYSVGAADLTGTLTINGPGLYVIQATSLTTASGPGGAIVSLQGGASPCDVWWVISSSAAIGTFAAIQGNMIALTSITIATSATLQGRALARNGTVTMDSNAITACTGGTAPGFIVPPIGLGPSASPNDVPALSTWAMIALTLLLAGAGFVAMRRRNR